MNATMSVNMSACSPRIGIWAALLSALFAACFSIVALAANFTSLVFEGNGDSAGVLAFGPRMTYAGALWIVTFPTMAFALAELFQRVAAADGRLRPQSCAAHRPALQHQPVQPVPVRTK
jgi:hypothetical protein